VFCLICDFHIFDLELPQELPQQHTPPMTLYTPFVSLLSHESPSARSAGLSSLHVVVKTASPETRLLIIETNGMLTAFQRFLEPTTVRAMGKAALDVLLLLTSHKDPNNVIPAENACALCLFESPLLPLILQASAMHKEAFLVINWLSVHTALKKQLIDFPGVADAIALGLKSSGSVDSEWIRECCIVAVCNISYVHVFDIGDYPEIYSGVASAFTTQGMGIVFNCTPLCFQSITTPLALQLTPPSFSSSSSSASSASSAANTLRRLCCAQEPGEH
jgi:hypothetical protein